MHTAPLVVAAFVAAASLTSAEPENRPKIYFPRHIKRQYTNHTITSSASHTTQSVSVDSSSHSSTKKDTISDLLSSLLGGIEPSDSTTPTSTSSSSSSAGSSSSSASGVSTGSFSKSASDSKSSSDSKTASDSKSEVASKTSDNVGSTNSVPPLIVLPTVSLGVPTLIPSDSSVSANKTVSATDSSVAISTASDATTTAASGTGSAPVSATSSAAGSSTVVPTTSSGILIAPTGVVTTSSASIASSTAVASPSTSSDGGLLGGVTSLIGGVTSALLPSGPANATDSGSAVASETSSATDSGLLPPLFPTTTSFPGTAPTASATSSEPPLLTIPPILGTGSSSSIISTPVGNATESSSLPTVTGSVTSSASVPLTTGTVIPANSTSIPDVTTSIPTVSLNTTSELPPSTTESSSIVTVPQNTTVPIPTTSASESTTAESVTLSTASSVQSTAVPITTSSTTSKPGFTSVPVIATITDSESWLPTTIIVQPSSSSIDAEVTPTMTSIPTSLPKAITPYSQPPEQPDGTTLIQISFLYGENYQHLVDQPLAASQMFDLLPKGLAHGGGYDSKSVVMYSIKPYNTIKRYGYITAQAMVYYPTEGVSQLADDVGYPSTALYNNADPLVRNLTSQINPAIGIMPGSVLDGDDAPTGGDSADSGSSNNDPFNTQGPGEQTTSAQQGMTAGIAVGAASVAGAYGAAMFFIARRYKRKKQRHQRSSSVTSPSEMRQTGSPALMGGALLSQDFTTTSPGYGGVGGNMRDSQGSGRSGMNNSARTANISAPVAAENSLGWN